MTDVDHYLAAATRDNTRRSYAAAVRHFEEDWGGLLPATADSMAQYLVDHAETHAHNTLKQRLAGLGQWHQAQGFPDPTKSLLVKKVLKGIRELHPEREAQAKPLQIEVLEQINAWLETQITEAIAANEQVTLLRSRRDQALVLIGFWRAFRSDELCRLQIEDITLMGEQGATLYLRRTKGDRQAEGTTFALPALNRLCPTVALERWLEAAPRQNGPLLCGINRWGQLSSHGLHPNAVIPLLRRLMHQAGIALPDQYSSHSLRRGFATWANDQHWNVKVLMEYVGWKDVKSALRYIDSADPFQQHTIRAPSLGLIQAPRK
jgi:integrase